MCNQKIAAGPFQANWESLQQYRCPAWFQDAKLGIFLHWGICTIPAFNGHYGRHMYFQHKPDNLDGSGWVDGSDRVYRYHVQTFGHPTEFGYKDFIPLWQAENFDADELTRLFRRVGAKYIVPLAVHHDNFDNWDSQHHRWNSVQMGPRRDIIGEWQSACAKHDMRFGFSTHLNGGHEARFFQGACDTTGPLAGVPYDTEDPDYQDLYIRRTPDRRQLLPGFGESYFNRHKDLLDRYTPDIWYVDGPLAYGEYGLQLGAHYYNLNRAKHGGDLQGVLNLKHSFPPGAATKDLECCLAPEISPDPWQGCTTMNPGWFYTRPGANATKSAEAGDSDNLGCESEDPLRHTAHSLIHMFLDMISKNGCMLLNVGQYADGSLSPVYVRELEKLGAWLSVNAEAVYGSRPWVVFGEGPAEFSGGLGSEPRHPWAGPNVRFTAQGETLYAFLYEWPDDRNCQIHSLQPDAFAVGRVELLATGEPLAFSQSAGGLAVTMPPRCTTEFAHCLRLSPA